MSYALSVAPEPLYLQVADVLRSRIAEHGIEPGTAIEPESVLVKELGVSRVTLRRAIDILVDEQLLVRRQGSGTFVASRRITYPLVGLHSTRDLARAHGIELKVKIDERRVVRASAAERRQLRLGTGERVIRFVRRDVRGREMICVAECSLPARFADCLSTEALRAASSYELIERAHGIRVTTARQVMRAEPASGRVARLLGVRAGGPVFVLERVTFERGGMPVEWAMLSYRHDRAEYAVELAREPAGRSELPTNVVLRFPDPAGRQSRRRRA